MSLSYTERIRRKIKELNSGAVITVEMFPSWWPRNAITRALSRLMKEGLIERMKKGVYSKMKKTRLGNAVSTPLEILAKEVHDDHNKCFGGLFLYNNLGLTTQVPSIVEILNNKSSYTTKLGQTTVRYVRIRQQILKNTKKYIVILEVLKSSKSIPDSNVEKTLSWILKGIAELEKQHHLADLVKIALSYPPYVRAILGNILQTLKKQVFADKLKCTLNANSSYKVGQLLDILKNTEEWRLRK